MGFSSYYSVVKHQDRCWSQGGSLSSFYIQGHGRALGSCFSSRKPVEKGSSIGMLKPWEGLTLLHGLGYSCSLRRRSMGHWCHLPGPALFCVCCSTQAIPRKQSERDRGMSMWLA